MQGNFWVCPRESASAVEACSSAIGAYLAGSSHHARGACEVSRGSAGNEFGLFDTMTTTSADPFRHYPRRSSVRTHFVPWHQCGASRMVRTTVEPWPALTTDRTTCSGLRMVKSNESMSQEKIAILRCPR